MTETPHPDVDVLRKQAKDHLWMHFTRHSAYDTSDVPVIVKGEGPYIIDAAGKRYLDALSGLFVVQAGHGREELAEAHQAFILEKAEVEEQQRLAAEDLSRRE